MEVNMEEEKRRQRMLDNIPTEFFRICDFMLMSVEKLMILVVAKSTVESLIRIEQEFFHLLEVFNNLFFKLINFKFQYSYRELFTVGNFLQLQFFLDILGVVVNMLQLFDQIWVNFQYFMIVSLNCFSFVWFYPVWVDLQLVPLRTAALMNIGTELYNNRSGSCNSMKSIRC